MASRTPERPNILFILSDDQGPWALGCAGNNEIRTPHLDRLADDGIRFENFFCTSPVCSPARASILTGRVPSQHGVHDHIRSPASMGENAARFLPAGIAYTDILAQNGYRCGISGKWHLGDSLRPQCSFTHWYVHQYGGGQYYQAPMVRDGKPVTESGYVTDLITDDAIDFIARSSRDESPFYLSVHYTAPHGPWVNNHPDELVLSYADSPFASCPQEEAHPWLSTRNIPDVWDNPAEHLKGYFAAVTAMDQNIGRIVEKLEQLDLRRKTLIFFTSDNGFNCGHHGFWGKGNGTYPQNMYDTSVKVPTLASHPGRIPGGRVSNALLSAYDIFPTLLEYAGLEVLDSDRLAGRTFLPILEGIASHTGREEIVVFSEYGPVRMIRTDEWKYVHRYPFGPHELYDLIHDPRERVNRIDDDASAPIRAELKGRLDSWFIRYADPRFDGSREPVRGNGQIDRVGPEKRGKRAFLD